MRKVLKMLMLSLMITVMAGCTIWREHTPHAWRDVTGGESLEQVFWRLLKAKNWPELESHLASTYVLVTPQGTLDRAAAIEHWKQLEIQDYSLGDVRVELNGNTYVVSYTLTVRGKLAGQPLPATPIHAMTVWQQYARDWLAIAHSAAPEPAK